MATRDKKIYSFADLGATMKKMVGTNDQAFQRNPQRGKAYESKYDLETAKDIIDNGNLDSLVSLSQYYWYASGLYRNFILYYATILTYDTLLVPRFPNGPKNLNSKSLENKFHRSLNFIESLNVPDEFARITYLMILNGAYYGLFRDYGDRYYVIQDLPLAYCRTRFKNMYKNNVLEFDMSYFKTKITDQVKREEALASFPPEFTVAYEEYLKDINKRWFMVPDEMGIAFYYLDQKPLLISTIPAIIKLDEYRDLEEDTDKQDLQKILSQKIPWDDEQNEPVLELPEIEELHNGTVGMLKNTPHVDVLTTFADIQLHSLKDTRQAMKDNLEKMERSVYIDAGISKQIFNAEGNIALSTSIKSDESILFDISRQYENWITYQTNLRHEDTKFYWFCRILPLTVYNRKEMHDIYLKDAEFGYSKFLPGIAGGTKQADIVGLSIIENDILDLSTVMVPLQSSHTQGAATDKNGCPVKEETQKSDKTIANNEGANSGGQT